MKINRVILTAWIIFLTGCSAANSNTAVPTVVLDTANAAIVQTPLPESQAGVTASGVLVTSREVQLSFAGSGKIKAINFSVGDVVKEGQVLAQLEDQASLQAALSAAQLELAQAQQAQKDLDSSAEEERARAMQEMLNAMQTINDLQRDLNHFVVPSDQAVLSALDALTLMKERLDKASVDFVLYKNWDEKDETRKDKLSVLDGAQTNYNIALKRFTYQYKIEVAQIALNQASQDYEILKSGPDPDELQLIELRLANAQAALDAAQAALDNGALVAPFDGTICKVMTNGGEWVNPGQSVILLADLEHWQVETTDLSERDVPEVQVGQTVVAHVDALQQSINGTVLSISPLADTLGGDVVYKARIDLEEALPGMRAGMTVKVDFDVIP